MDFLMLVRSAELIVSEDHTSSLMEYNELSADYGLWLTLEDSQELMIARDEVLADYGRIEIGSEILGKLITYFCCSPYIQQIEYTETLMELQELFHYVKTEVEDSIGDDELLEELSEAFNNRCRGVMELLKGKEADRIIRRYRFGVENEDNWDDDPEDYEE